MDAHVNKTIMDRMSEYQDVLQSKDITRYSSYWASDARILKPVMDMSGDELVSFVKGFWESGGELPAFHSETFDIFVHGDVAYQIGQYDETFQMPGEGPVEFNHYFFSRWEKQPDGTWMMTRFVGGPRDAPEEG